MYPPDYLDDEGQALSLDDNGNIVRVRSVAPIQQEPSFQPLEDLRRAGSAALNRTGEILLGLGSLVTTPPVVSGTNIASEIGRRSALSGDVGQAARETGLEQFLPMQSMRDIYSMEPDRVASGIGGILPDTLLALSGIKTAPKYLKSNIIKDVTPRKVSQKLLPEPEKLLTEGRAPEVDLPLVKQPDAPISPVLRDLDLKPTEAPVSISPRFIGSRANKQLGRALDDNGEIIDTETGEILPFDTPQEMKVPDSTNIAVGPRMEDTRLLEVLGSKLYADDPIKVTAKELIQNTFDEHLISGSTEPIRILLDESDIIPGTNIEGKSITVRDRGRGMTPEQLYTVFTDVGKTGKAGITSAAGGFGFAKAAPLLGGKYIKVESIVDEAGQRKRITFEGNPQQLIQQGTGVPLKIEEISSDIPTGLKVTTYFDENARGYTAKEFIKNSATHSLGFNSPIELRRTYGGSPYIKSLWLDYDPEAKPDPYGNDVLYQAQSTADPVETIEIPGSKIEFRYNILDPKAEKQSYQLHFLNKGLYQNSQYKGYGNNSLPNLPDEISANIISTVEEEHPNYPFSANREQLARPVSEAIDSWVREKLVKGRLESLLNRIQRSYDEMIPLMNIGGIQTHLYDQGNRFSPTELSIIQRSAPMQKIVSRLITANANIIKVADNLGWDYKPSEKLKKFGLLFAAPDETGSTTLGIHIPNPATGKTESAILVNIFEILNSALKSSNPVDHIGAALHTTLTHEMAHIPGGGHDTGFAYRDANLRERLGMSNNVMIMQNLASGFGDIRNGQIDQQILDLLQLYNESRQRPASTDDPLLSTGVSHKGQSDSSRGEKVNTGGSGGGRKPPSRGGLKYSPEPPEKGHVGPLADKKTSPWLEAWNLPRALKASMDLSAPFRQGLGLIHKDEWWRAFYTMFTALGEGGFQKVQSEIKSRPIFRRLKDNVTGKELPSYAERMGLKLTDLTDLTSREEQIMSTWAEKVPGVRASNRAYTAFLNKLRADVFEDLIKKNNALLNEPLAKALADFVNISTGRGSLGRLEKSAVELNMLLFSPRLIASRLSYFNPGRYINTPKPVRMEMLKSLFAIVGTGLTIATLAKLAGADVSLDPSSTDFGKIKIGKTRLDPWGGFQQYAVAAYRLISGKFTSSSSGKKYDMNKPKFAQPNRLSVAANFARSKAHPTLGFAMNMMEGKDFTGKPLNVPAEVIDMFIPMIAEDTFELAQKDPKLIPLAVPAGFGFGVQTYDTKSPGEVLMKSVQ